jgi:hypothetical protein
MFFEIRKCPTKLKIIASINASAAAALPSPPKGAVAAKIVKRTCLVNASSRLQSQ